MAETLILPQTATKAETYQALLPQIAALTSVETDLTANLANIAAALKEAFGFFWVGFYLKQPTENGEELVLGPFQGPIACTRIGLGKGVCGSSWARKQTIVVEDVEQFPGHIACSSAARSEIVVPVIAGDAVAMVLDVDSDQLAAFDATDAQYLEQLAALIADKLN